MELFAIDGNGLWLDGGAMFGNAPRSMWSQWHAPDAVNRIEFAGRALLVRERGGRQLLFEAGIGDFFSPNLRARYGVTGDGHALIRSLHTVGVSPEDVDVVVLSHLHFDHAGGLLSSFELGRAPELVFPKARFVVGAEAWGRACKPHLRDRASFIPELPALLEKSGRLHVAPHDAPHFLGPEFTLSFSQGHTPGMMHTRIQTEDGAFTFAADLVPARSFLHAPITMGYDRFAETVVDEKTALLSSLHERGESLFFTHDLEVAACRVALTNGRFVAGETSPLRNHGGGVGREAGAPA